jgi:V8-like Glu-specific endopeptidase
LLRQKIVQLNFGGNNMTQLSMARWLMTAIGLTAIVVPTFNAPASYAQRVNSSYPTTRLAKGNARAKLDPALLKVPAMPQPEVRRTAGRSTNANQEVSKRLQPSRSGQRLKAGLRRIKKAQLPRLARQQARTVIGRDDRKVVNDTTVQPVRAITKIFMTFPNGKTYSCSGAMIAAKYVLTAGHCVHSKNDGGWATRVEVIPGMNDSYKPYGSAFASNLRSYSGWMNNQDNNADMALITLDREIGNTTGWFNYASLATVNGVRATIAGYPADLSNGMKLYTHAGRIRSSTATRLAYPIDTAPGQSGSPIYQRPANSSPTVFGVHTSGTANGKTNSGVRIDPAKFQDLQTWIGSGT